MKWLPLFLCLDTIFLPIPADANSGNDPFLGANQYPQYRNISGLSGGGFGINASGYGSLTGATAFSTPIAYVLGHGEIRILGAKMTFGGLNLNSDHSNGSGVFMIGGTIGHVNAAFTDFIKSSQWDQALNLQLGFIPSAKNRFAFSIGVQDIIGHGGAAGIFQKGDSASTRSLFAVSTYRAETRKRPIYFTLGIGTRRYRKSFASVSTRIARPLRGYIEYDGFGFNEGLLYTMKLSHSSILPVETDFGFLLIRGRYPTLSIGFGF